MSRYRGRKRTQVSSDAGIRHGFRSGLEEQNAQLLLDLGVHVEYEKHSLKYHQPAVIRTYTPDFILPNGIVVETKGLFTVEDRKKHLLIRQVHPELDLRFVFANANQKLRKGSPTSYAKWCDKHAFKWAHKTIPSMWVYELQHLGRLQAVEKALKWQPKDDLAYLYPTTRK